MWGKKLAVSLFGDLSDRTTGQFEGMRGSLSESGLNILFRTYVSLIYFYTTLVFLVSVPVLFVTLTFFTDFVLLQRTITSLAGGLGMAAISFVAVYYYPGTRASDRRRNIDANLPFAINHMAAIAASGVPPHVMFKLISEFGEYGEISKEFQKIVRGVESFGQDITTAIDQTASSTPSEDLRDLLFGMLSIIQTGGNLRRYLKNQADQALFMYRIHREEYLEALSTYADFYTAVLIAAPLFLISILAVINIIGGTVAGLNVQDILTFGIFLGIPVINTLFLAFIHVTQPEQV